MPGLKTTLTMDGEQYDATLVRARAAAAVAGQDIQRSLSVKIDKMAAAIERMPQGRERMDAEQALWAAKMRQSAQAERSITALTIAENDRRIASDRNYFTQWAAMSAAARQRAKVADRVGAAAAAFSGAGGDRYAPQGVRDELAQALRAQRALRNLVPVAGSAGAEAGAGFMAKFLAKVAGQQGKTGMMQMIHVLRTTFGSIVSGMSPWKVLLYAVPQAMQAMTLMGGGVLAILGSIAVAATAVAAIIAAPFVYLYRVNSLAKQLTSLARVDVPKPDLTQLSAYEAGWRRIREAIAAASDEINSANQRFETMSKLMDQAQSTEKRMLEIKKQKEMDLAGDNPKKKAEIRAKYLKEEHDLQKKQMDEKLALQGKHVADLQKEQEEKTEQARAINKKWKDEHPGMPLGTEESEAAQTKRLENQVALNSEKDKDGKSRIDRDKDLVEKLTEAGKPRPAGAGFGGGMVMSEMGLNSENQAKLEAAKERIEQANKDQAQLTKDQLGKKDRDDARSEQKRLYAEAEKAGGDKIKAAKAFNDAQALNARILADDDKIREATADEKNARGGKQFKSSLNKDQQIGAYSAAPVHNTNKLLEKIAQNTAHLNPPSHRPVASQPARYGGIHH